MAKKTVMATANVEMRTLNIKQLLEYKFTSDEIHNMGQQLARRTQESIRLEDQKKAATSEFKSRIEAKQSEIKDLSNKISSGNELRNIDCIARYNFPVAGVKTIIRLDLNEEVDRIKMSAQEMQLEMELEFPDLRKKAEEEKNDDQRELGEGE